MNGDYKFRNITKEDIYFLKELQNEINTQDTICQRDPRFWVVMQTVRTYGFSDEYSDDYILVNSDDYEYAYDNIKDSFELIEEYMDEFGEDREYKDWKCEYIKCSETISITGILEYGEKEEWELKTLEDVMDFMNDEVLGEDIFKLVYYKDEEQIVPNTFFLTKRECEEHIKRNSYHYNKPHSYAMTAWRSSQVEKLYDILHNVNWNNITE